MLQSFLRPLKLCLGQRCWERPAQFRQNHVSIVEKNFICTNTKEIPKNPLIISRWNDNPPALPPSMGSPSPASPPPRPRSRGGGAGRLQRRRGEPSSSSFAFLVFAGSLFGFKRTLYQGMLTDIKVTIALVGLWYVPGMFSDNFLNMDQMIQSSFF